MVPCGSQCRAEEFYDVLVRMREKLQMPMRTQNVAKGDGGTEGVAREQSGLRDAGGLRVQCAKFERAGRVRGGEAVDKSRRARCTRVRAHGSQRPARL